jgi:hypothetical protein
MMKKGDILATLKAHFFAVTATQKEGFIPLLEQKNDPMEAAENKFCSKKEPSTNQTNVMNSFSNR